MSVIAPGLVGEATIVVGAADLATNHGSSSVRVFATPAMIGLMEGTAAGAVDPLLPVGQATVGTIVNVRHLAATPLGSTVRARAELVEVDGRRLRFVVEAFDEVERIGVGEHERYIVDLERFQQRTSAKRVQDGGA
ncbi:MAG: thioesterase family protein [Chloroflexi bacterium]|nr:thioesterase family protein [Chloroflexota bacterium]